MSDHSALRENLERLDDTGTFLRTELGVLYARLDAIKREAAAPAPVAAPPTTRAASEGTRLGSPNSGVGGPPVPPAPGQTAGSHRTPRAWLPAPTPVGGDVPAHRPPTGSPLDRLMEAAGPRPGAGRPRTRTGSGRLGRRAVTTCIAAGLVLGLLLCAAAVTARLYLP